MGHSTASGRSGTVGTGERSAESGKALPRGVAENSRLGRAWRESQQGNASLVDREYAEEIQRERDRMNSSRNSFVRQTAQQTIDRLTEERRRIQREFLE